MKIWTKYAKDGDPSIKGLVDWPAWESLPTGTCSSATNRRLNPAILNWLYWESSLAQDYYSKEQENENH